MLKGLRLAPEIDRPLEIAMPCEASIPSFSVPPSDALGARARYELRFQSLFHTGRALTFPCDVRGEVHWDTLSDRARNSFLRAQESVGIEFATPAVHLSDLH
jgi:hypothetical protein